MRTRLLRTDLAPGQQTGIEGGIDLLIGRMFALQITRYDQLASGLIQRFPVAWDSVRSSRPEHRHILYALQNVGEITNRGWEVQGTAETGRFSVVGAVSLVESRVRRLAAGYTGDLRPGDRMLEVPARTASLTALWSGTEWSGSLTAHRASDWINYDRLALAGDFANDRRLSPTSAGAQLREYWREYEGNTSLNATTEFDIRPGLSVLLQGDNLLNQQRGEPDVTILPGRTITVGLRAAF